jgi:DNA polymerase-3 subunit beta
MIRRTIFAPAVADNAKFAAMTGILVELEDEKIRLVATDGRRLALVEGGTQAHGEHGTKGQMPVIPAKAMTLLERNLVEPDELVRISIRQNDALLKTERAMIYTRLVEGKFPDYKMVVPQKGAIKIPLTVGPFHTAIRQAAIMTDQESKRVIFRFEKNKLTLQARGIDAGRSRVEMPLDYSGSAVQIDFDPKFLLDMLKVLEPDTEMTLELNDGKKPALFRIDANYRYVVVPLQPVANE